MAETANIAKMADILAKEIFSEFFWQHDSTTNSNFNCEDSEHGKNTHPADIVFFYDEPYHKSRTYILCDLKSYASNTLKSKNLNTEIVSLAQSMSCAEKSNQFQKRFFHSNVSPEISGLLFIYNHDNDYDKDFNIVLDKIKIEDINIPKDSKIVILGPLDIYWLDNVRLQLIFLRGTKKLPSSEDCRYFYPHLVRYKNIQYLEAKSATLEMLTAPWIILTHTKDSKKGYTIFYKRKGESVEEFLYFIDYLLHFQILIDDVDIEVFHLFGIDECISLFNKAKTQYIEKCKGTEAIEKAINSIQFSRMHHIKTRFSELEIGINNV
ncbi:hypothetical protein EHR01_10610 [Leptospira mtsangambouensis]|uniref:Caspase family p20 domain-containing protein n=1 Tax=Leptospira mtsangambouensis TaxID=2484912 RepID=A0ABY2NZY1_9LEPT|nr:hypothetical protein [Leptospira mtsangambouensis]TGM74403.1 hypothetical protein EHR01_10610 [Leptospira mtsangambouensis]